MNFREEYKNSIEIAGPSAEQLERMKSNVLAQVAAPAKKALPLKRIAAVGSAVAACAVISVAAVNILPRISSEATMGGASSAANSSATVYMDAAANSDEEIYYTQANDEVTAKSADGCAAEDCSPESGDFSVYESQNADCAINETFAPDEEVSAVPDEIADEPQSAMSDDVCCNAEDNTPAFGLDADFTTLILDDVKYILTDTKNFTQQGEVVQQLNIFAADGTEYLIEIYDECIVLSYSTNGSFDIIGEYIKAE